MLGNDSARNDYNIGASQTTQSNFETVASQLEAALERRDQDVRAAMADYQADGVSDEYQQLEHQWNVSGAQVRDIIQTIRNSLQSNDEVAYTALQQAKASIPG